MLGASCSHLHKMLIYFGKCENKFEVFSNICEANLVESMCYNVEIYERKVENAKENLHNFATYGQGIKA